MMDAPLDSSRSFFDIFVKAAETLVIIMFFVAIFSVVAVSIYRYRAFKQETSAGAACLILHPNKADEYEACVTEMKAVTLADRGYLQYEICNAAHRASGVAFKKCFRRVGKSSTINGALVFGNAALYNGKNFEPTKKEFCQKRMNESTSDYLSCLKADKIKFCEMKHPEHGDDLVECVLQKKF